MDELTLQILRHIGSLNISPNPTGFTFINYFNETENCTKLYRTRCSMLMNLTAWPQPLRIDSCYSSARRDYACSPPNDREMIDVRRLQQSCWTWWEYKLGNKCFRALFTYSAIAFLGKQKKICTFIEMRCVVYSPNWSTDFSQWQPPGRLLK